jgi:hypothetical protein
VRHGLVVLDVLDVPDDDLLLSWANTPFKPLAGQILFFGAKGGPGPETLDLVSDKVVESLSYYMGVVWSVAYFWPWLDKPCRLKSFDQGHYGIIRGYLFLTSRSISVPR